MPDERETNRKLLSLFRAGNESALDELVKNNLPLVKSVASRFFLRGETEDLIQTGAIGLLKAIRNFDPEMGTELSTYAVPMIAGEIRRYLRDSGSIKAGRRIKELSAKISRLLYEAEKQGRDPKLSELADKLGVSNEEAAEAAAYLTPVAYLDKEIPGGRGTALSSLVSLDHGTEEQAIERVFSQQLLLRLDTPERELITLRYITGLKQTEAAERLGITQPKASRLETRALMKLRSAIMDEE